MLQELSIPTATLWPIGGQISGAGTLTKVGIGTLTLGGVNTFTGGLIVNAGAVQVSSDAGFGSTTAEAPVNLSNGSLIVTMSFATPRSFNISGSSTISAPASIFTLNNLNLLSGNLNIAAGTVNFNQSTVAATVNAPVQLTISPGATVLDGGLGGDEPFGYGVGVVFWLKRFDRINWIVH